MKKLFFIFAIAAAEFLIAQTYYPFPKNNTIWTEVHSTSAPDGMGGIPNYYYYGFLNRDTIISSKIYHQLYRSTDTVFTQNEYIGGIREDSLKRIYFYGKMPYSYSDKPIQEFLLYDFSVSVGDTIKGNYNILVNDLIVTDIDSILLLNGKYRRRIHFNFSFYQWIEGIGNSRGPLWTDIDVPINGTDNNLMCFSQHDTVLLHSINTNNCFPKNRLDNHHQSLCSIYPNPVVDESTIEIDNSNDEFEQIEIYNQQGMLYCIMNIAKMNSLVIDKKDYPSGVYFIKVINKKGEYISEKFVII